MKKIAIALLFAYSNFTNTYSSNVKADFDVLEECQSDLAEESFRCCYSKWIHYFNGEVNDNSKCTFYNFEYDHIEETDCNGNKEWKASNDSCDMFDDGQGYLYYGWDLDKAHCGLQNTTGLAINFYWNCTIDSVKAQVLCDPTPGDYEVCKGGVFNVTCTATGFPRIFSNFSYGDEGYEKIHGSRTETQDKDTGMYTVVESLSLKLIGRYSWRPLRFDTRQQNWNWDYTHFRVTDDKCSPLGPPGNGGSSIQGVKALLITTIILLLINIS